MNRLTRIRGRLYDALKAQVALAACVALVSLGMPLAHAQASETVRGTVRSLTTAPRGETDGAVLDNGVILHWPPHLEDEFATVARVGDRVEAVGENKAGKKGDKHFEVTRLTNLRTDDVAENDHRPPPPKGGGKKGKAGRDEPGAENGHRPPPPKGGGKKGKAGSDEPGTETARGVVRSFTTAPKGETDGAVLDNGMVLHWPPHREDEFKSEVGIGDYVEATGRSQTTKGGERRFEVKTLSRKRGEGGSADSDRAQRLRSLERQLEELQREIERLRREA